MIFAKNSSRQVADVFEELEFTRQVQFIPVNTSVLQEKKFTAVLDEL